MRVKLKPTIYWFYNSGSNEYVKTPHPQKDLFFWCLLFASDEIVKFIWTKMDDGIRSALVAACFYRNAAARNKRDTDKCDRYNALADKYEQLAIGVFQAQFKTFCRIAYYFWRKISIFVENFDFCRKFRFLSKISIFVEILDFCRKFESLTKHFVLTKLFISGKNLDFIPKIRLLTKH